ncbi:glycosyltransferase family 2 protein [Mesobacterium pallidum]|uniref:glycosyltransferase family 2 protein n=1 Tax=Mesobacterium pallidum TaxID=2872037 RepID=UPI001EE1D0CE|nr:glycosyltransferase family 2 protein [Mesobacterium pallidum]
MRIVLHIGLDQWATTRVQKVLDAKRQQLLTRGVLFARSPGGSNHTRLFMAVTDPDHIDTLRLNRGYASAAKQADLRGEVAMALAAEVEATRPEVLILSAYQLGTGLITRSEIERLRTLLLPLSDDISLVAHVDEQARMLVRHYAEQVTEGRAASLKSELSLAGSADWWEAALDARQPDDPASGYYSEVQAPPFWLDLNGLQTRWEEVFGPGSLTFRGIDIEHFAGRSVTEEITDGFALDAHIGRAEPGELPSRPSAATLTRGRQMNALILKFLAKRTRVLPRQLWRKIVTSLAIDGAPLQAGTLSALSEGFAEDNAALIEAHPGLSAALTPDAPLEPWVEAPPERGFRASQYLLANLYRIDQATREVVEAARARQQAKTEAGTPTGLTPDAERLMPPLAKEKFKGLVGTPFAPHNRVGRVNEEELAAPYAPAPPRDRPKGSSGNVIVGCMKNEAPYIVEWVAYHRAMGFDNFLIYTNDCTDGTDETLDRLQDLGVLQHRLNNDWKGNSPQQHALNRSLSEPVIVNADWIAHVDVDEFVNVRCGNGTLDDFFDRVPDATNVAMTWRLFGHSGVTRLDDRFVIEQFDRCAPKFCPKPHTVWGFKTMFKNIGAYSKISCHRPNKLDPAFETQVKWVNGSGQDMTSEAAKNGWRNSVKSIGYDLIQLNHYALRSAESFLIKRQRGRALHVDRSIGLNYWIRMDWGDFRDITIQRNLPRLRAEYDRLMADDVLWGWHEKGLEWHRAKAAELHANPEFEELYTQALDMKLTETERVAYALALDLES